MTHTPGPWEIVFQNNHPHQIETVSKKFGSYRHLTNDLPFAAHPDEPRDEHGNSLEQLASLRLMAAAPAMLEALEARIEHIEETASNSGDDPTAYDWQYDELRAVVKLAKGD